MSPQDLAVVCAALIIIYLIVGENAEFVCDLFTSLPAVVFTYQVIIGPKINKAAYVRILKQQL